MLRKIATCLQVAAMFSCADTKLASRVEVISRPSNLPTIRLEDFFTSKEINRLNEYAKKESECLLKKQYISQILKKVMKNTSLEDSELNQIIYQLFYLSDDVICIKMFDTLMEILGENSLLFSHISIMKADSQEEREVLLQILTMIKDNKLLAIQANLITLNNRVNNFFNMACLLCKYGIELTESKIIILQNENIYYSIQIYLNSIHVKIGAQATVGTNFKQKTLTKVTQMIDERCLKVDKKDPVVFNNVMKIIISINFVFFKEKHKENKLKDEELANIIDQNWNDLEKMLEEINKVEKVSKV